MKSAVSTIAALLIAAVASSAEVAPDEARAAVQGWAALGDALTGGTRFSASEIANVTTYEGRDGVGTFHVVSFVGGGYAVTSGDTEVTPILAYSEDGAFVASDDNPLWAMLTRDVAGRTERLGDGTVSATRGSKGAKRLLMGAAVATSAALPSKNASAWSRLQDAAGGSQSSATGKRGLLMAAAPGKQTSVADLRVGPLCTTLWNQEGAAGGYCYNYYTPEHFACGCVATAMAQVMEHFEWPKSKVSLDGHTYSGFVSSNNWNNVIDWWDMGDPMPGMPPNSDPAPVFGGPAFGGPYDWANMPDDPDGLGSGLTETQRQAIGLLCRDCGIALDMIYDSEGSLSFICLASAGLVGQFGYANAEFVAGRPAVEYLNALVASFDLGSPCLVGIPGHAVVSDGYGYSDSRLYLHFNWGWGNSSKTAWYAPPMDGETGSSYPVIQEVAYNIYTPETCSATNRTIVSGRVLDDEGVPVSGQCVTATNAATGAGFSATSDANGIYALLLPPDATYVISATKDGRTAKARRSVGRNVSTAFTVNLMDDYVATVTPSATDSVANLPGVDLTMAATGDTDGWVDERLGTSGTTGVWSDGVEYEQDGTAYVCDNVFTPFAASTGNVVKVEFKARLYEEDSEGLEDAGAQAAIRLGTNGCFQVWTRLRQGDGGQAGNGWLDVLAEGVTPTDGEEWTFRFTFDYRKGKYTVSVLDETERWRGCAASGGVKAFPLAADKNALSGVSIKGETSFTSLLGKCMDKLRGFVLKIF